VPLIGSLPKPQGFRIGRRSALVVAGIGAAAALSVATISNPWLGRAVNQGISSSLHGVETVAAMLADRSPGARPEGALANLKHKRQALHERALPKIRSPYGPPTAYEALAAPPPIAIAPLPPAPLFATIAGGPPVVPPGNGGGTGGPPILSNIPGPGGGGGFSPPVILATPQAPTPAEAVPEPASWAMMLLGFALMGRALRRREAAGLQPARH
jgi:hypothetical protein